MSLAASAASNRRGGRRRDQTRHRDVVRKVVQKRKIGREGVQYVQDKGPLPLSSVGLEVGVFPRIYCLGKATSASHFRRFIWSKEPLRGVGGGTLGERPLKTRICAEQVGEAKPERMI
jgi:hypothetical protein